MNKYILIVLLVFGACSQKVKNHIVVEEKDQNIVEFLQEDEVQLAVPNVIIDSILFYETAILTIEHGLNNVQSMYAIDNAVMKEYLDQLEINESCLVKIKSIKQGFQDSETLEFQFLKVDQLNSNPLIKINPNPSDLYPGEGARTISDLEKGSLNFKEGNRWLGFQSKQVEIEYLFEEQISISRIYVSLLSDPNAWIFKPVSIQVYLDEVKMPGLLLGLTKETEGASLYFAPIKFKQKQSCRKIKLVIESMETIPSWHQGEGTAPWLFIDEIILK